MEPVIETLATGDEVVNGDVVDSNAAYICKALARRGHLTTRHNALPDDRALLIAGIREISVRADLCICSGGLGPTEDDLTAEVVAEVMGTPVKIDEEALARMKARFEKIGYRFSENNLRSAQVPQNAKVHQNEVGTAPAFSAKIGRCQFFFLPGVPKEFYYFADEVVLPWSETAFNQSFGEVAQLKTLGWGESHLAEKFEDFGKLFPEVKVGYRIHAPEVWIKLTARASSRERCRELLRPAITEVEKRVGSSIFGRGDEELGAVVHQLLLSQRLKLATAESCTGGLIGHLLTSQPGSSAYYQGGVVSYSNEAKTTMLGVPPRIFMEHGAVSAPCAEAMAKGILERLGSDLAIAVTGIAGPTGGTADKPVGLVFLALASRNGSVQVLERQFRGDRARVQKASALTALEMVRRQLLGQDPLTPLRRIS